MKLLEYLTTINESELKTKLGETLSDYWEQGSAVSPAKAAAAADEFYQDIILDGVYDFIEYVSDLKDDDDPLAPEAKKFAIAFIESLKKKLDELKNEIN